MPELISSEQLELINSLCRIIQSTNEKSCTQTYQNDITDID
jgi:hypothetical protein